MVVIRIQGSCWKGFSLILCLANGHSALYPGEVVERGMPLGLLDELPSAGKTITCEKETADE
jgi:hypothetical protein